MGKKGLLLLVVIAAFWQISFLQNGMKWDFIDAFLPSRYFFSESVLNNQFPLWNPYLLYGIPVFADLVSVFNPEFWVVANLFGYSNISLQFIFLGYIFLAGISFTYFLKQFNVEQNLSLGLSVAYMLSGLSIGHAQHLAFVYSYALVPFVVGSYFSFIRELNKPSFVRLSISLFLMIFGGYPGFTIILGYFLLTIFIYCIIANWPNKKYRSNFVFYHLILIVTVLLFSSVLIVAYFQGAPFLSRYGGVSLDLAQKHSFTLKSIVSFILPMATGDAGYFETDVSTSNGYFGIIGLVLFLFSLSKKVRNRESFILLFFGIFALLASFGKQFFLRELLYRFFPLMNMFQYPSIFRGFAIFSFLAYAGINIRNFDFDKKEKKIIAFISGFVALLIGIFILSAIVKTEHFAFLQPGKSFSEELVNASRFDNIIFQGTIQIIILIAFTTLLLKIKDIKRFSLAVLSIFVIDGIAATQLNIHYTVISEVNPVRFYEYLKASPKGFPIPELNPIGENTDNHAHNDFVWMNNNVFPKKITFDGKISFKLDGYNHLADNYPELLEAIKKQPVAYFSDDGREDAEIENFTPKTVFLSKEDFAKIKNVQLKAGCGYNLKINNFSPAEIEITTNTNSPQLLVYQQNYFTGWKVFVDGKKGELLTGNFTHMATLVPAGTHTVTFKFTNSTIKLAFLFSYLVFFVLIVLAVYFYTRKNQGKKKQTLIFITAGVLFFISGSLLNRYWYEKNKWGISSVIAEKTKEWKQSYGNDVTNFVSTRNEKLKSLVTADTIFYVDETTGLAELSQFLLNTDSKFLGFSWQGGIIGNNIKELVFSFYPKILEQNMRNNSGLILLEKAEEELGYQVNQTFEIQGTDNWTSDRKRIKTDSITGNHFYTYSASDEWGPAIELPVDNNLLLLKRIVIITDFLFEDKLDDALLVFTTQREGETQLYEVSKLNEFVREPGEWGRIAFSVNVGSELQEGDRIIVYFWNIKKIPFQVDNLKLKYYYK